PNTVVKLSSAHGSWGFAPARVGRCQATTEKTFKRFFLLKVFSYLFNNWVQNQANKRLQSGITNLKC
ncbi:hypothetical protein, partial [Gracilibacillus xinjiangensis]